MLASRVVSSVVQRQVKHVTPVARAAAEGLVAAVYDQVEQEMRLVIPPVLLHSPSPEVLAAYWMLMREPLMAAGAVDRATKEAVAAAVSVANICPYCVDMHSTGMYDLADADDAEAIVADRPGDVADPTLRPLVHWARTAHLPDEQAGSAAPFAEEQRAELVGVVVAFHYLTRMVNVFLASFLLPPRLTPAARRRLKHGISLLLSPTLREVPAGRALSLLPATPLPTDAGWAAGSETVAGAVARAYAALEAAGDRSVPPAVRALVHQLLADWRGEETGLDRQWCEDLVERLPVRQRAAGRLALLTAVASYQVDESVVAEFRREHPGDRELVEVAAWASLAAARRVGAWHLAPDRAAPPQ
ncbi:carboxymuconolactone decarboxylase family protein [Micromonospora sp. KC213]|uniref:carboxymuconolactone decarboxylase family protein n=1 Tax=Micromonospora sp. KC213 TaxID=2530378 RepID=UPI00104D5A0D|nr:carboxymuconolactone decarboxylase family protein [Micromonospora sp. KC213]TDC42921.1 carboxymuconolactone decarboxylase [Micromonospora sp. KC213]